MAYSYITNYTENMEQELEELQKYINCEYEKNFILYCKIISMIIYSTYQEISKFIYYIQYLIRYGACFSDENNSVNLKLGEKKDVSKEISDFVESKDQKGSIDVNACVESGIIFTKINNGKLKISKLLKSDFCKNHSLYPMHPTPPKCASHFDINGNLGYAQKDPKNHKRNYVVYHGSIKMMASWMSTTFDKNNCKITKKENICVSIRGGGTIEVNRQDKSRYKNGEINFSNCNVLVGGVPLKEALNKGRWLSLHMLSKEQTNLVLSEKLIDKKEKIEANDDTLNEISDIQEESYNYSAASDFNNNNIIEEPSSLEWAEESYPELMDPDLELVNESCIEIDNISFCQDIGIGDESFIEVDELKFNQAIQNSNRDQAKQESNFDKAMQNMEEEEICNQSLQSKETTSYYRGYNRNFYYITDNKEYLAGNQEDSLQNSLDNDIKVAEGVHSIENVDVVLDLEQSYNELTSPDSEIKEAKVDDICSAHLHSHSYYDDIMTHIYKKASTLINTTICPINNAILSR